MINFTADREFKLTEKDYHKPPPKPMLPKYL